jgi:ankyrin repeat protein
LRALRLCLLAGCTVLSAPGAGSRAALIEAVQNDDRAAVAALLNKHADVNVREDDGATALAWAAVRCNQEIAALLLNAGADPNLANEQGIGPLYLAITNGSTAMVQLVLAHGANANLAREDGETPLMTATRLGQIEVMRMLLDRGANVNAREKKFGQTALMWATGQLEAVRLLVQRGADVQAKSKTWDITSTIYTPTTSTIGKTGIPWNNDGVYTSKQGGQNALLFAVQKHDLESVKVLLDAGVDAVSPRSWRNRERRGRRRLYSAARGCSSRGHDLREGARSIGLWKWQSYTKSGRVTCEFRQPAGRGTSFGEAPARRRGRSEPADPVSHVRSGG